MYEALCATPRSKDAPPAAADDEDAPPTCVEYMKHKAFLQLTKAVTGVPEVDFDPANAPPAPDYARKDAWICLHGTPSVLASLASQTAQLHSS